MSFVNCGSLKVSSQKLMHPTPISEPPPPKALGGGCGSPFPSSWGLRIGLGGYQFLCNIFLLLSFPMQIIFSSHSSMVVGVPTFPSGGVDARLSRAANVSRAYNLSDNIHPGLEPARRR